MAMTCVVLGSPEKAEGRKWLHNPCRIAGIDMRGHKAKEVSHDSKMSLCRMGDLQLVHLMHTRMPPTKTG